MNSERNSCKRPMSELKNKKGGVSSSCSKNLPPRYLVNTNDYTCVNETFFTSPRPIEFNSENEVDHESLNRHYTNFEEELEEEVEINEEDERPLHRLVRLPKSPLYLLFQMSPSYVLKDR